MSTASDTEQLADGVQALAAHERTHTSAARRPMLLLWSSLALLLAGSIVLSLWVGRGRSADPDLQALFLGMRAYRVGVAFFAGAALAVGGVVVQGLFRNPLASPYILGTSAGSMLGGKLALFATFVIAGGHTPDGLSPEMLVPFGCVIGAALSLVAVLTITSLHSGAVTLILTGYVLNGLFLSFGTLLSNLSQESFELQRAMTTFMSGTISGAGANQLVLVALLAVAGSIPALFYAGSLDVLLSGEEEAGALGVDVPHVRFWCVVWASLVTAGAVAVGGGVSFIGLVVPHAVRRFTGPLHRQLLPAACVAGGAFLILCDVACRAFPLRSEVPLAVLTELVGAPIFLWMLRRLGHEGRHA